MGAKESTASQKPPDDKHLVLDAEGYSLVLDAEKNLVETHGDEAGDSQSADRVLRLEIHGMGSAPVLHLKIAEHKPATDKYLYEVGMDWTAGMVFFLFRLPETYPGGRTGLLRIVRDLCDGSPTLGVTKIIPGRAAVKKFIRSRKHPETWEDSVLVNGIKVDWKRKRPGSKRLHIRVVFPGAQEGTNMIVLDESSEQLKAVTSGDLVSPNFPTARSPCE
ncbi:hypothetical protein N7474_006899 [Penicillium riverlandense]|uniref:uncharacterized protein n=1 Tax=Penicillium riverlandense TaxID=1903569 RepID=UPI002549904B|nr:uncharacterized protein N7474_006899 [Penicillium riverlandense]KAJ5815122.1 hypothetical protein N7474_006899 [Penicillium riverlandense]